MKVLATAFLFLLAVSSSVAQYKIEDTTNKVYMGYKLSRDTTPYRGLSIDCAEIRDNMRAGRWPAANTIYTAGKNFKRVTGVRSLQTIANTARPAEAYYVKFAAFYSGARYIERAILSGATGLTAAVGQERANVACLWTMLSYVGHELDVAKKVVSTTPALSTEEVDDAFGIWYGYPNAASLSAHNEVVQKWIPCAGNINNRIVVAFKGMYAAATAKNQATFDANYNAFFNLNVAVGLRATLFAGTRGNALWQKAAFGYFKSIQPLLKAPTSIAAVQLANALGGAAVATPVQVRRLVSQVATQQGIPLKDAGVC